MKSYRSKPESDLSAFKKKIRFRDQSGKNTVSQKTQTQRYQFSV